MKTKILTTLLLTAALCLCACSYQKPERYNVQTLGADSITTVCGTDCSLSDVKVVTAGSNCSATYVYTGVDKDQGVEDARTYHQYLAALENCLKIDDFSAETGYYTAYLGDKDVALSSPSPDSSADSEKAVALGISIKVSFTADSYTVTITDNIILDDVLKP